MKKKDKHKKKIHEAKDEIISINAPVSEELIYTDSLEIKNSEELNDLKIEEPVFIQNNTENLDSSFLKNEEIIEMKNEIQSSVFLSPTEQPSEKKTESIESIETKVFEKIGKKEKQVYQITYYDDKQKEIVHYTEEKPEFVEEFGIIQIVLKNCFKKFTLAENILNKKLIKVSYKGEQTVSKIPIDLRMGIVIKTVIEAAWMKVIKEKAENHFKTKVLEAYREFAKELQITPTSISDNETEFESLF